MMVERLTGRHDETAVAIVRLHRWNPGVLVEVGVPDESITLARERLRQRQVESLLAWYVRGRSTRVAPAAEGRPAEHSDCHNRDGSHETSRQQRRVDEGER